MKAKPFNRCADGLSNKHKINEANDIPLLTNVLIRSFFLLLCLTILNCDVFAEIIFFSRNAPAIMTDECVTVVKRNNKHVLALSKIYCISVWIIYMHKIIFCESFHLIILFFVSIYLASVIEDWDTGNCSEGEDHELYILY